MTWYAESQSLHLFSAQTEATSLASVQTGGFSLTIQQEFLLFLSLGPFFAKSGSYPYDPSKKMIKNTVFGVKVH